MATPPPISHIGYRADRVTGATAAAVRAALTELNDRNELEAHEAWGQVPLDELDAAVDLADELAAIGHKLRDARNARRARAET